MKKRSRVHWCEVLYTTPKTPTYFGHSLKFETTRKVDGDQNPILEEERKADHSWWRFSFCVLHRRIQYGGIGEKRRVDQRKDLYTTPSTRDRKSNPIPRRRDERHWNECQVFSVFDERRHVWNATSFECGLLGFCSRGSKTSAADVETNEGVFWNLGVR